MRVFQTSYKDRNGKRRTASRWYVETKDHLGIVRRIPAFTDKRASESFGRQVESLVALRIQGEQLDSGLIRWLEGLPAKARERLATIGLLEPHRVASAKTLKAHQADYEQSLRDSDTTPAYVKKTVNRVTAVFDGIGAKFLSDVKAPAVSRYLAARRADGLSNKSSNHYLAAVKAFMNWMVKERRVSENPIAHLSALNTKTDRRHVRRPLEPDEIRRLLAVARGGSERYGMTGEERFWLYRLAIETGVRSNELRQLTRADFDLDGPEPSVTIRAAIAKNRSEATIPLRPDTANELQVFLGHKLPSASVFTMPRPEVVVIMLRTDLAAAGISYIDDTGRVCDFHSLRSTFASLLLRSGVDVRTAKDLMRHSTIAMTADVYACTMRGSQADAVQRLPDLSCTDSEQFRATGTENVLASCLARECTDPRKTVRHDAENRPEPDTSQTLAPTGTYGACERTKTKDGASRTPPFAPPPRGIEPLLPA